MLIGGLIDAVSKNGALLLNVGPRPDDTIPEAEVQRLEEIGASLAVNGEAMYRIRPCKTFGEGPSRIIEGHFTDTHRAPCTSADIRFTCRRPERIYDDILYATVLARPDHGEVLIRAMADGSGLLMQTIRQIDLLGGAKGLPFTRAAEVLRVVLPDQRPAEHALALRIYYMPRTTSGSCRTRRTSMAQVTTVETVDVDRDVRSIFRYIGMIAFICGAFMAGRSRTKGLTARGLPVGMPASAARPAMVLPSLAQDPVQLDFWTEFSAAFQTRTAGSAIWNPLTGRSSRAAATKSARRSCFRAGTTGPPPNCHPTAAMPLPPTAPRVRRC
jgi:hypothetical protein